MLCSYDVTDPAISALFTVTIKSSNHLLKLQAFTRMRKIRACRLLEIQYQDLFARSSTVNSALKTSVRYTVFTSQLLYKSQGSTQLKGPYF